MYNEGSCELSYKPFYHPIEATIRWCELLEKSCMPLPWRPRP